MQKHLSTISLVRSTDRQPLPGNPLEGVVLSSTSSQSLTVEQHHWSWGGCNVNEEAMYMQHVIDVNVGRSITAQYKMKRLGIGMHIFSQSNLTSRNNPVSLHREHRWQLLCTQNPS